LGALRHYQLPMEALMNKAMRTVLTLTAMLAAGCQDNAVAPRASAPEPLMVTGGGFAGDLVGSDTARFDIVIDPWRTSTFSLGAGNYLTFPARSVCDPALSTYGPTEWDKACTPATRTTTIHVKAWLDKNGTPRADFSPNVRFVPSVLPTQWVTLTFTSQYAAWYGSNIVYCADPTQPYAKCVNETAADPTLATVKDPVTGRMTRRIKHFSGYSITTGEPCDPSPEDPDCVDAGDGGFMNRISAGAVSFDRSGSTQSTVNAITRDHSLPDHPTKDGWVGPLGGELRLPQAGVTLIIPAGAVDKSTHFSITAVRGNFLAYEFEPHGIKFNKPVLMVQDLRGTSHRLGQSVIGAYFSNAANLDQAHGKAKVDELLSVTLNTSLNQATMPIWHFSGYMMASGRDE
jgi:hypothetical protein